MHIMRTRLQLNTGEKIGVLLLPSSSEPAVLLITQLGELKGVISKSLVVQKSEGVSVRILGGLEQCRGWCMDPWWRAVEGLMLLL